MIHKLSDTVYLVEVPEGASEFEFNEADTNVIMFLTATHIDHVTISKPGQWSIVGLASECTEEQAKWLVEEPITSVGDMGYLFNNYNQKNDRIAYYLTALESLLSFCRSVGVPAERLLIIKKK